MPAPGTAAGDDERDWAEALGYAAILARKLALPVVDDPRITLARGESACLTTVASYLRGYRVGARLSWGDRQGAAVLGTTQRIVVNHRLQGWTSFWLRDLRESNASLEEPPWSLELTWVSNQPPLRFTGPSAPLIAVHVAAFTDPVGWTSQPGIQPIVRAMPPIRSAVRLGSFHRLHPGVVVVVNRDIQSTSAHTRIRAGTQGVIVRREVPWARVQFDNGRAVLVDPSCLDTVR